MIRFVMLRPCDLGYIPGFLSEDCEKSAKEQIDEAYQHGGGWRPFTGFTMDEQFTLHYPGDPSHKPLAVGKLRDELIFFYDHAWVAIVQPDMSFEIARID